jgi:hypothetical protein
MANIKISQLTSLSTMTDAAVIPVVAAGVTQQISGTNLKTYFTGSAIANGTSNINIATANGNVTVASAGNTWTFGTTGTLTLPGATAGETIATSGGYITVGNLLIGQGGALFNSNNDSWALYGNRSDSGTSIFIPSNAAAGNGTPLFLENQISNVEIRSGFGTWTFDSTGAFSAPGNITAGNLDAINLVINRISSDDSSFVTVEDGVNVTGEIAATGNITGGNLLTGGVVSFDGGSRLSPLGANLDIFAGAGAYVNLSTSDESSRMGVDNSGGYIVTAGGTWGFGTTGNLTAPGNISAVGNITGGNISVTGTVLGNSVTLNTSANVSVAAGQMAWNSADGTMDIGLGYGNVVLQTGQETHYVVRNETGTAISNGTAVYCSGVTPSGRISVDLMTNNISPVQFLGLATQDISNGVNGIVTWFGYVRDLDTRGTANTAISVGDETWAVGDKLYVHPTAAGKLTKVEPAAPNAKICVASIITRNQSSGALFVRPTTNLDMVDLSDVQITTPATNQFLVYAGNRWENTALDISLDTTPALGGNLAGAGFNISNVGNITATNLPTKFSGSWSVATGNSTQSFTVDGNNTYQMWVEGNIPNGIIAWNALVTVTNTNVPVLGQQFAWNYEGGGNVLMFNSIPDQIIGTAGAISNAEPAVSNTNTFSFGINNASGNTVTVDYGWVKLS